jgi:predicted PP-loop superfamily ATPase
VPGSGRNKEETELNSS